MYIWVLFGTFGYLWVILSIFLQFWVLLGTFLVILSIFGYFCTPPPLCDNGDEIFETFFIFRWTSYPKDFEILINFTHQNDENLSKKVSGFAISNTLSQKLLGVIIDNKLSFKNICTKASQKLHALSRISNYMELKQRMIIMYSFILSQFGYCHLLVWMFYSRQLNNRITRIHERSLRIVYQDFTLLEKHKSFTIYKDAYGISSKMMRLVLPTIHGNPHERSSFLQTTFL